jgi:hypothetical protein
VGTGDRLSKIGLVECARKVDTIERTPDVEVRMTGSKYGGIRRKSS